MKINQSNDGTERRGRLRRKAVFAGLLSLTLLGPLAQAPAHAEASAVSGGAFGFYSDVKLGSTTYPVQGTGAADAVVNLPAAGSTTPIVDYATEGTGVHGPATIYRSVGPIAVSTEGSPGNPITSVHVPAHVSSSASATNIGTWAGITLEDGVWTDPNNHIGIMYLPQLQGITDPFIALSASSACAISQVGTPVGTTTITQGRTVENAGSGYFNKKDVDQFPAANTSWSGSLYGDSWTITFNEQIVGPTSITVNAVHLQLKGPIAVGDLYIAQSRCGYTP